LRPQRGEAARAAIVESSSAARHPHVTPAHTPLPFHMKKSTLRNMKNAVPITHWAFSSRRMHFHDEKSYFKPLF
jgi:hypothetical protein